MSGNLTVAARSGKAVKFATWSYFRGMGDQRQALARAVVKHDEDAHAAAVDELIGDEVERPAVIRPLGYQHRRPCAQRPLSSAPTTDHETLVAIDSEQALVIYQEALPSQQDVKAPVAEAPALMGQGPQPLPQSCVVWPARMIPHRHSHAADNGARPPLADLEHRTQVSEVAGGGKEKESPSKVPPSGFVEP